jgi:mono/diheme cytochrome c family protein
MDEQDKEFETFLQQFQLRRHTAFPAEVPVEKASRWHGTRWVLAAAAAAVVVAVLSLTLLRSLLNSSAAIVELAGDSTYQAGETIAPGTVIRSGGFETLVVRLNDGTRVEMRPQSRIVIESAKDGVRVRLDNGSILVRAAKQRNGQLYVKTNDTLVTVVGTLFLVEFLPQGSRVAVLEGEVEIRWGTVTLKLVMGQQFSSNPEIEFASIEELIAWSREIQSLKTLFVVSELGAVTEEPATGEAPAVPGLPRQLESTNQQPETQQQQPQQEQQTPRPSSDAGANSAGQQIFNRACLSCHSDEVMKKQPYASREEVTNRISRDVLMGAQVSQAELPALIDYIFRVYGVKGGDAGQKVFKRACVSCHNEEVAMSKRLYTTRESVAERVSQDMAYGATVSPAELPVLIDYLFRQ